LEQQQTIIEKRKSTTTGALMLLRMATKPATRTKMPWPSIRLAFVTVGKGKQSRGAPLLLIFSEFDKICYAFATAKERDSTSSRFVIKCAFAK
jgi:hypothetical protein